MKKSLLLFVSLFLFVSLINANDLTDEKYSQIENTLIQGLSSDNIGLQVSSATILGEVKSERAVNPLTAVLRNSNDDRARKAAALSLVKIGTDRSLYVIKQAIRFNDSENVRAMCAHLHNAVKSNLKYEVNSNSLVAKN